MIAPRGEVVPASELAPETAGQADDRTRAILEHRRRTMLMPLLGRIAEPQRRLRTRNAMVMLETPRSPEAEAFRILATNVEFMNLDAPRSTR